MPSALGWALLFSPFLSLSPPLRVRNNLRSPDICFLKVCLSSSSGICHAADNQVGPLNPDDKSELRRKPFCGRIPSLDGTLGEKIGRCLIWSYPTFPLETLDRTSFRLNFVWSLMWATSIENSLTFLFLARGVYWPLWRLIVLASAQIRHSLLSRVALLPCALALIPLGGSEGPSRCYVYNHKQPPPPHKWSKNEIVLKPWGTVVGAFLWTLSNKMSCEHYQNIIK